MRVENLEVGLGIVDLVLGLDGIEQVFVLNQCAVFLLDEDDLADPSEVGEDVVDAVMVVVLGQGPSEQHLRRAIFQQKLLGVRIDYGLGLPPVYLGGFLPGPKLLALQGYFPELLVNIHEVVERAVLLGLLGRHGLGLVLGGGGAEVMILLHKVIVALSGWFLSVYGCDVILEGASSLSVGAKRILLRVLLFFEGLVVNATEVVIVKLYVFQLRAEDVHLAAVLKDDLVVEVEERLLCLIGF